MNPNFTGPSPSELNRRILLIAPTDGDDDYGGKIKTYSDESGIPVWAKITTMRSDEAIAAMQTTGTAIHNILIRYRTDVKADWRIKRGSNYYDIIGPPIDLRMEHRWLDIKARELS